MKIQQGIRNAVLAAILGAFTTSGGAQVTEDESTGGKSNHPIESAQQLTITGDPLVGKGSVTVSGVIGTTTGAMVLDADFYSFYARAGDTVTIDIDGGTKKRGEGRSVDTIVTLFRPGPPFIVHDSNDDRPASDPNRIDPGSLNQFDARLDDVYLDVSGIWTVGVTGSPGELLDGGIFQNTSLGVSSNGSYTLIISGVSLPVMQIRIDVMPGSA